MSRIARIITTALLALVCFAPATTAAPAWDQMTAPVPTTEPPGDHRSPDARDAAIQAGRPGSKMSAGTPPPGLPAWPVYHPSITASTPATDVAAPSAAGDEDDSPLVFILGGVTVSLLLAGGLAYAAHSSRRSRRARVTA
jgi:hypothetical protein